MPRGQQDNIVIFSRLASFDAATTKPELSKLFVSITEPVLELSLEFRTTLHDVVIFEAQGSLSGQYFYLSLQRGSTIQCAYKDSNFASFTVPTRLPSGEATDLILDDAEWHRLKVSLTERTLTVTIEHELCGVQCSYTHNLNHVFALNSLFFGGVEDESPRTPVIVAPQYTGMLNSIMM